MKHFDVYPLFEIEPVKGEGSFVWDKAGQKYLDLYGGHAVISIGHSHPHYVQRVQEQVSKLGFYSNSVQNSLQLELAAALGRLSGYEDFDVFLCNSGAEANENALKLASFHNQKSKILIVERAFHGRTSGAVAATDNPKIQAAVNPVGHIHKIPFNDISALEEALEQGDFCAVIIESIQGVGGIHVVSEEFWQVARALCDKHEVVLIADEIQCGYGRSGKFFAHQHANVEPDLITVAKGMGNGFPIGGVLIHPKFKAWPGMLGTTFGGNHLACAAGLAVLEVIEKENLLAHTAKLGAYWQEQLKATPGVGEVRGQGLMIGVELAFPIKALRKRLLFEQHIFTGSSSQPNVLRLLPPLNLEQAQADHFTQTFQHLLSTVTA